MNWLFHSLTYVALLKARAIRFRHEPYDARKQQRPIPTFDGRDITINDRFPRNEALEALVEIIIDDNQH